MSAQQPVTGQRFHAAATLVGQQPQRLVTGPGADFRLGQARPPGLVLEAQHPVRGAAACSISSSRSFFLRVLGVGADQPVLGTFPADAQALQSPAQGLAAEAVRGPALLVADFGGQLQRP